jgi:phosphopantetheine adenylyltransferase/dephospho-CoA kinase
MIVIGLTGGIASGKSTVSSILKDLLGVIIIDADKLGHKAYQKGTYCYDRLVENFGQSIVAEDGQINRRNLGDIVFSEKSKMTELTGIVWPEIRKLLIDDIDNIQKTASLGGSSPVVAIEAAIMLEAGWEDLVSMLWVVQVDRQTAIDRLVARNNLSPEEALKRIESQMSNDDRCKHATYVLQNDLSEEQLKSEVRRLFDLSIKSASGVESQSTP